MLERGSIAPIAGARVSAASGDEAVCAADGSFVLSLPAGSVELIILADQYEPLRVREQLRAGEGLQVEYRLLPLPGGRRRYASTVRGEARHEGERFTLRDQELHEAPGTLGDPFRTIGLLPGVAMPLTLLPIYVIRGASPGTNGFFLDGMRVPQLFHFLVGGGVVHPRLVDRLDFYPGAYDVTFGRTAGGVIDAETRPARSDARAHGEVELRVYELSAMAEANLPKGVRVEVSGHYGWPAFLVRLFDSRANLSYWDFQLRLDWKGLTVEALGSYDTLSLVTQPATLTRPARVSDNRLNFYRVQVRDRERFGRVETEFAIVAGFDDVEANGAAIDKWSLNFRALVHARWPRFRLDAGGDLELSRFIPTNFVPGTGNDQPDALGDLGDPRNGIVGGGFVQGTVEVVPRRLQLTLGVRADAYHAGAVTLAGLEPRLNLRAVLLPWLSLRAGVGLYQQPPAAPVALPGIDTFALQLGLQRAIHGAYGIDLTLPQSFSVGITAYYEKFLNINDAVLDFTVAICTSPPPESLSGYPARILRQLDGQSYGLELMARRTRGRITGWIAYTLSRSERVFSCGLRPADYDQTHVLNVVVQARLPWRLMAGAHLYVASGRPVTVLEPPDGRSTVRNNTRLPTFVQLDLRLDREWLFRSWALSLFLDVLNVTYSESVIGLTYPVDDKDITHYDQPRLDGFRWALPSLGLRARF